MSYPLPSGVGEWYSVCMFCKRCQKGLTGRQESYCSLRCSKLHLKSLYRKRNRAKLSLYNRSYRGLGMRPLTADRRRRVLGMLGGKCLKCGSESDLNIHHWRPARLGGTNHRSNLSVFCFSCHQQLHHKFDMTFWK